jgi:PAS domain S-box-containing protein
MFLDRQLCIRKFTPRIAETFRVIPNDVGRPLEGFTHDLAHPDLMADVDRVLREGITVETQTWDRQGRCLFLRILPYRAPGRESGEASFGLPVERSQAPDGVVLTLTDISALEHARARLAQLSAIVESTDEAIIGLTLDGVVTTWNAGATRLYGYPADEAIGRHASFLSPPGRKDEIETVLRQVGAGTQVGRLETQRVRNDGAHVDVSVTFSPIHDSTRAVVGVSGISRDITELVQAGREIAEREARIRLLLDSTAEAIYGIDLSGVCIFCNSACARLLGYDSPSALIGRQVHPLIHHTKADGTPSAPEKSPIFEAMRHREGTHVDDDVIWRTDGTSFPAEYWSHPILRDGEVIGAVVTFLDITERRAAEREVQEGVRRRSSWRCSPMSCAIRSRRSSARRGCWKARRGPTTRARRRGRWSRGRPVTCPGCSTIFWMWRASPAGGSRCGTRSWTCGTRRVRPSRRSGRSWRNAARKSPSRARITRCSSSATRRGSSRCRRTC